MVVCATLGQTAGPRVGPLPARHWIRRAGWTLSTLALSASCWAQTAGNRLPMRNLLVEVRQVAEGTADTQRSGVTSGQVVIGTGGVTGQTGVEWRTARRDESSGTTQQVRVLNGGVAGVRVAAQTPWQFVQVALGPQGPVVMLGTAWIETATGFRVLPRWPGGGEPVTVELSAESASAPQGASGTGPTGLPASSQGTMLSTLQMPLGEWVTVARSRDDRRVDTRGTLSSGSAEVRAERVLQMRVTAP